MYAADGVDPLFVLSGHEAAFSMGVPGGVGAFSRDGSRVVTISDDKTIRIWNTDGSGEPLILRAPDVDAYSAAFSPDGKRIVSASHAERVVSPSGAERIEHTAVVWPNIEPFTGVDDPRLWTATSYCPSIAQRMDLLGVREDRARDNRRDCLRRVAEAQVARPRSAR